MVNLIIKRETVLQVIKGLANFIYAEVGNFLDIDFAESNLIFKKLNFKDKQAKTYVVLSS